MPRDAKPQRDCWWLPNWRAGVVLLLIGLVINLGVAVAIAKWGNMPGIRGLDLGAVPRLHAEPSWYWYRSLSERDRWPGPVPASWSGSPRELLTAEIARRADPEEQEQDFDPPSWSVRWAPGWCSEGADVWTGEMSFSYDIHRIGFPFGVLRFDVRDKHAYGRFAPYQRDRIGYWYDGIEVPTKGRFTYPALSAWILPIYPQALGLIVNTLFYASCLWSIWLFIAWPPRRRAARLRRGECVRCRYPIVPGKQVCPECGTWVALPARGNGLSNGDSAATDAADALDASAAADATADSDHPTPNAPHRTPAA